MKPPQLNPKTSVKMMFMVSMFVRILDMTIVVVALPSISRDFHIESVSAGIVVLSYLFGLVIAIPAANWLGDRFGTKRVFVLGIAVFTIASALCGMSQNLPELVGFRLLQGLSGGVFGPVVMAMLVRTIPASERIKAARVMTIPIAVAPLVGSTLGGVLTDVLSWRWIFYINLPIGAAATAFALLFLVDDAHRKRNRFDILGFLTASSGLTLLMYALNESLTRGWGSRPVLITGICGALLLVLLVVVELRATHPLLDLRVFSNRIFRVSIGIILTITAYNAAYNFVFTLLYQNALGRSATQVGIDIAPAAIGAIAGAQVAVRMYQRLGARRHMLISLAASFIGLVLLGLIGRDTQQWFVWLMMFFMGAVGAIAFNAAQTTSFATMTPAQSGVASSVFSTAAQTGSAIGVSLVSSALVAMGTSTSSGAPNLTTYHVAFVIAGGLALIGFLIALKIRDSDAASTMKKKPEPAAEPVNVIGLDWRTGLRPQPVGA
jgi:EmrB/QacA subfamily drug resistance transporter